MFAVRFGLRPLPQLAQAGERLHTTEAALSVAGSKKRVILVQSLPARERWPGIRAELHPRE